MPPAGYKGLVTCDTRRAEAWRAGLERAGFHPVLAEARGDKGDWEVAVPLDEERGARAFVTEVVQGKRTLPSPPFLSATAFKALVAIGLVVVGLLVAGWLER
jgi:hypothetical protein